MSGFVYFIRPTGMPGPVKIGLSKYLQKRLLRLNTWAPFPLEVAVTVPGDEALEINIHDCLVEHHSHGEWFHPNPPVLDLVEKLRAGVPIGEAIDLTQRRGSLRSVKMKQSWVTRRKAAA